MADNSFEQMASVGLPEGNGSAETELGAEQKEALALLEAKDVLRELADITSANIERGIQPPSWLVDLLKPDDPAAIPGKLNELAGVVFKQIEIGDLPETR